MEVISGPARAHAAIRAEIAVSRAARDCAFLAAVVVISLLPYVHGLGFYYDDYSVLQRMDDAADQSLAGLYDAVRPATGQRPLQALVFATLYKLFGLHALGYHLVNAALLVAVAVVLYLALRELRLPRLLCVALPLVYSVLPHYATNRFWLDAFQINLSSLFYVTSLYAGLRALRARRAAAPAWLLVAAACVAGSLFAYEVVFPLFALNVVLLWRHARRTRPASAWLVSGAIAAAVLAAGVVKTTLVAEKGQNSYELGIHDGLAHHLAYLVSGSIKVNVGTYFLALPYVLWWIVRHRFSAAGTATALGAGLVAFAYVWRLARAEGPVDVRTWRLTFRLGLVAFVLGYAVFLTNERVLFRSAGIDNRVNAAAALGVAAALVGGIGWAAARAPAARQARMLAGATAVAVAIGTFVVTALGGFWDAAAREQHAILTSLQRAAPSLPASSTVVLDHVCPEAGPAVVFGDEWDFRNAVVLAYDDPSLRADTATDELAARPRGLRLSNMFLGRTSTRTYAYGPRLFVYDYPRRALEPLPTRSAAARYVAARPPMRCMPQRGFAWGLDPFSRTSLP